MKASRSPPAQPPADADSLDFTAPEEVKPGATARARRVPPQTQKARTSRSVVVPALIITVIAVAIAVAMTERAPKEVVTARPSAQPISPAQQIPPAYKAPPTGAPSASAPTPPPPPPASAPKSTVTPAVPADFLKVFDAYAKQAGGGKAIALALAHDGKWAYGTVSGFAAQSDANDEAVSECTRFKSQAGVQANCRLYAAGDKVVW